MICSESTSKTSKPLLSVFFFLILVPFIRNFIVSEGLEKLNCGWEGTSKTFVLPSYCLLVQKLIILTKTIKAKTNKQKH